MAEFIGRFHPLIVHLPIGILMLAFLMEIASRFRSYSYLKKALGFVLQVALISAVFSLFTGWIMPKEGAFEQELIRLHFWSAVALTIGTLLLNIMYKAKDGVLSKAYLPTFFITMAALTLTGHFGGSLTHGSNHLTKALNKTKAPAPITDINSLEIYNGLIQPILKKKCFACHNSGKQKGGLNMETIQNLKRGGETGAIFVPGNIESSPMIQYVELPMDDDLHMPPKGKSQLTKNEIKLLKWWVREGAHFDKTIGEIEQNEEIESVLKTYESIAPTLDTAGLKKLPANKLNELVKYGIKVYPIKEESPLVYVNLSRDSSVNRGKLKKLRSIADHIIELDLSFSSVTDQSMSEIANYKNLTKLKLQQTRITSKGIEAIKELPNLQSLNLYGTAIDDGVFDALRQMKTLKSIYLYETKTTDAALLEFSSSQSNLDVNKGANLSLFGTAQLKPPIISARKELFEDTMTISLDYNFKDVDIYYTLDGSTPDMNATKYTTSFMIDNTATIKSICTKKDWISSSPSEATFIKVGYKINKIQLSQKPNEKYKARGKNTLIDLDKGSKYSDGKWLGFEGENLTITLDLGTTKPVKSIVISSLEDTGSYIFLPKAILVSSSVDGTKFIDNSRLDIPTAKETHPSETKSLLINLEQTDARFLRLEVLGNLVNPAWHPAPGAPNWIFIDEVIVN